ncbi:competence/damage-inducible protein A [Oceanibacterium hippocampi]|uniref:Nicotinamide-nucleotide amidohydrolase PncC n=1 Tax=Oceanibacterium hippocampi TaxID=745714 RepID=A0A1Y5T5D6_9PROT|nr:molybdopterin-binding protein [Oceanibacterium hippocampi]SLN56156.1 Nicotinamide-nucleotide amidohydrolase PncC [Oceanibacterium hippocampi]
MAKDLSTGSSPSVVTAAVIVIGDEILSGRTRDKNLAYLAVELNELGVQLREARFVPDIEAEIVAAVNQCRARYDYVFTSGGIGPTHDDITADSVAAAFGVPIDVRADALAIMQANYKPGDLNEARRRMARIPEGAALIDNPVSRAPGFRLGNVYVMAGIPTIMQAMFQSLKHELVGGAPVRSIAFAVETAEGIIAAGLGALQKEYPDVSMGSYPGFRDGRPFLNLVLRSNDPARLALAADALDGLLAGMGLAAVRSGYGMAPATDAAD